MIRIPYSIAISGFMGTGKTTLARALARRFGWTYLHESGIALKYLPDLFQNTRRWAFETQTGFLSNKALQIIKCLHKSQNFILDRSIYEDAHIFAAYFYDRGDIDDRSYSTYTMLASYFQDQIPSPDLLIFCDCPVELALQRLKARNIAMYDTYPYDYFTDIASRYSRWSENFTNAPAYAIDSENNDFTKSDVIDLIINDIILICDFFRPMQYNLFKPNLPNLTSVEEQPKLLKPLHQTSSPVRLEKSLFLSKSASIPPSAFAYVAAPFTMMAKTDQAVDLRGHTLPLFPKSLPHGKIPSQDAYRKTLLAITKALESSGITCFLPHRDVNKWGSKVLTPEQVVRACSKYVSECDLFIGILGESFGAHFEFGIALGLSKPAIIIHCEEMQSSFIARGVTNVLENVHNFKCKSMAEIPKLVKSPSFLKVLAKYVEHGGN